MIGSRRSGLERDTCGLARWIGEVSVDRIADYRGGGESVGGTRRRGSRLHGRNRYIREKGHGEVEGKRQRGSLPLHEAH